MTLDEKARIKDDPGAARRDFALLKTISERTSYSITQVCSTRRYTTL
jgi:hypothetical protein